LFDAPTQLRPGIIRANSGQLSYASEAKKSIAPALSIEMRTDKTRISANRHERFCAIFLAFSAIHQFFTWKHGKTLPFGPGICIDVQSAFGHARCAFVR
jgi:hypothetical protein